MANHNLPTLSSTYADFITQLDARFDDILVGVDAASTGLPNNTISWNGTELKWKKYVSASSTWTDLSASYSININGTVGATTPTTGAFTTLSASTSATLPASTTIGGNTPVTTTGTQTLTNKTLTSPVISSISNTGTITLPTATTTLVGRDTTDTLTNKTLTAPRFADLGFIADANGNEILQFDTIASAVNYIAVENSATNTPVKIIAAGDNANVSLNLIPKGTGTVQLNGVDAVSISGTQTLTNKTISTGSSYAGSTIATGFGGTGTTTAPVAGSVVYGLSTTAQGYTAAGTAGQLLQSNGSSAPSWVNASTLSVNYATSAGSATSATTAAACTGNSATVTNGVYTTGNQTIGGTKTFSSPIYASVAAATNSETQIGFTFLSGYGSVYFYIKNDTNKTLGVYDTAATISRWTTDVSGNFIATGNVTAYSDERLKRDWESLPATFVKDLAGVKSGTYSRVDTGLRQAGISAQSLQKFLPEVVISGPEENLSVNYGAAAMVSVVELAKLVLELQREIQELKQKLA